MFSDEDLRKIETPKWFQQTMIITIAVVIFEYGLILVLHVARAVSWIFHAIL